jgi:hypothetical protein
MYFPTICVKCHYKLVRRRLPSPPNTYLFEDKEKCPVCDGTEGKLDHWVEYKELDRNNLELLRFLAGKPPLDTDASYIAD